MSPSLRGALAVSLTAAGLVMTPLSVSMVIGAMLASPIIGALKRYQIVIILGALLMGVGAFCLTLMTPATSLLLAILLMALAGPGTGTFFSLMAVAQNVLPVSRLRVHGQASSHGGIGMARTPTRRPGSGSAAPHSPLPGGIWPGERARHPGMVGMSRLQPIIEVLRPELLTFRIP